MEPGRAWLLFAAVVVLLVVEAQCERDFYKILGVPRNANNKQIRKAFRDLSLQWHPDKNPGDEAAKEKYMDINAAYEALGDEEKRRMYDQYGEEGLKPGAGQRRNRSPFDIFGFGGGGGSGPDNMKQGAHVELKLSVTLEDLYLGKELKVLNRKQMLCSHCRGTGAKDPKDVKKCTSCGGTGVKTVTKTLGPGFVQQMQTTCNVCNGKGKIAASKCPHCGGHKVETGEEELMIIIEKGMPNGHRIVFQSEADEAPDTIPGDLVFVVDTAPHPVFRRDNHNLHTSMTISLLEALTGFRREITHLDGRKVPVERSQVTIPGQVITLRGEGFPHHEVASDKGDLFIEFTIAFPKELTAEQKEGFKKLLS